MTAMTDMTARNNSTKTAPAVEGTDLMNKFKHAAAVLLCLTGLGSGSALAQSLILKNATTGSTLVQYPLATSASCVLTGTGDIEVRPQPSAGTSGDGWCPEGAAPTAPTFPAPLAVTPTAIITGNTVSASWTSSGATSCTGSATRNGSATTVSGWTGTQPLSFTNLQLTPATAGAYIFTITCTNTAGSTPSSSATINVSDPGSGACAGVPGTFTNLTRQTTFNNTTGLNNPGTPVGPVDVTTWSSFIGLGEFPNVRSRQRTVRVERDKFIAIAFNTGTVTTERYGLGPPNPNRFGSISWVPPSSNPGEVLVAISECPGVFDTPPPVSGAVDPNNNAECLGTNSSEGRIDWGIDPTSNNFVCRLQENKTYYVNVAYVKLLGQTTCLVPDSTNACHWLETIR